MILGGWAFSNDVDKQRRWEQTVAWATDNGCPEAVEIADEDYYCASEPTSYAVGPKGYATRYKAPRTLPKAWRRPGHVSTARGLSPVT